ncbi:hypothetical protein [Sinomicrobium weinanense]|uniref:Uncharacterized protein n=1 Tax=Sinomicrobium weinanense TaxID=2842200 RepID=A0A926Q1J8_9FLAO|nr:hypothetical protein [Sinomicrobium weinanense]MBC9795698.1 hypothetical protein [Sinomicrobium weinanense]MBU3125261.1 hypothetical protein [Sinomicrobium weinanense]
MKNIFKIIAILFGFSVLIYSCDKDPDKPVYDLIESPETGAVLRTISIDNNLLDVFNPESAFKVTLEEQDEENGALMENIEVLVAFNDRTPDNGTTPPSEAMAKTIPASDFSSGPIGLPRATVSVTFGEAVSAMGLTEDDYDLGDIIVVKFRLNLTDGRSFGPESSSSVLTGIYFNSPFQYNSLLSCTPPPGDYVVKMFDSFGDGWQTDGGNGGSGITVVLDGSTTIEVGMCSYHEESDFECTGWPSGQGENECGDQYCFFEAEAIVTIPEGTTSAAWNFPGDQYGEIRFEIYAPDGSLVFDSGDFGETGAGLLPFVVCAD